MLSWESSPLTQAQTHLLISPSPTNKCPSRCTRRASIYRPQDYPQTYLHTPPHKRIPIHTRHTRTLNIHLHTSTDSCKQDLAHFPKCSPTRDMQAYANISTYVMYQLPQLVYGTSVLPVHRLTLFARNPGYAAKRRSASPRVTLEKPPPVAPNSPLVSRPATPSPYSQRPAPHQAAPDSAGSGFGVCTTTLGAGEGGQAAA